MHPNDAQVKTEGRSLWFYRWAGLDNKHSDLWQPEKKISRLLGPGGYRLVPVGVTGWDWCRQQGLTKDKPFAPWGYSALHCHAAAAVGWPVGKRFKESPKAPRQHYPSAFQSLCFITSFQSRIFCCKRAISRTSPHLIYVPLQQEPPASILLVFGEQQPTNPALARLEEAEATPKAALWVEKHGTCS